MSQTLYDNCIGNVVQALFNIKLDRYKGFAEKVGKLFPALQAQLRSPFRRVSNQSIDHVLTASGR